MKEPVGILGAGWVGLVTGACLAELGHDVVLRDVVPEKLERLAAGELDIYEPGLAELLARNRARIRFTVDAADVFSSARLVFVCVGTPPTRSGDADMSAVWHVIDEVRDVASGTVVAMKSTVPVGTGAKVRARLLRRGVRDVEYVSNPEFLAEGTAVRDFMHPDRIVIGACSSAAAARVAALYESLGAPVLFADVPSAETIKLASNAFLATRISFINEIANVCEEVGADVEVVSRGMGYDRRIGPHFLRAGIGFGGSCLGKDIAALKQLAGNTGYHFQLLAAAIEVNELQKRRVVGKLVRHLGPLRDKAIALLGLAFKPDTNDLRDAASLVLAARLVAEGATVRGWDPVALAEAAELLTDVELAPTVLQAVEGADAAVIVTEWPQLRELASPAVRSAMRRPLIVDGRNLLDPGQAAAAGFVYEAIGRPSALSSPFEEPEAGTLLEAVGVPLQRPALAPGRPIA
jgi:UDPglucose 6-dehydrogenase